MNDELASRLQAALTYASRGWLVFPLHSIREGGCSCGRPACESAGKHPRTLHGLKDATVGGSQIREWWNTWPDANVGIVTGSRSGLVVVDIDPRNGGDDSLADLERTQGPFPKTIESLTGGGGQHFYFQHPGGSIKSKPLAEGIDIKADGGYVVAPPSSHRSGEPYRWEGAGHPEDVPLAALPGWLCAKITGGLAHPSQPSEGTSSEKIQAGSRNKTLASLAGAMRRQHADEVTIQQALRAHNQQCCDPPLPDAEVKQIAWSIAKYPAGVRTNPNEGQNRSGESDKPGKISCADQLMQVCEQSGATLFHDQFQEAYAWVVLQGRREVVKIHSKKFREWIAHQLWLKQEKAPASEGLQSAINILSAQAKFTGPEHRLWNRVAWHEGALWYDLGNAAVRITSAGWEIMSEPPLLFQRYAHQRPQVRPEPGGDLRRLLPFVNIPGSDTGLSPAQLLFLVSVVVMVVPTIPHPVLCVHAEQGSGKTTLFKVIRELIDPSATPTLGPQDSVREFVQVASHHWALFLDNLTTLPDWLSDAICRCVTGEGFSKRELFSDDEDILYSFLRCVGLNGINLVPSKPDLLDRAVILPLERIADRHRRTEREFWEQFQAEKPQLIGALCTVMSQAMALIDRVQVSHYPRLADFAQWGAAVALALGTSEQAFLNALSANTRAQTSEALEASPVAQALLKMMEGQSSWVGRPHELLKRLDQTAKEAGVDQKSRLWPKDPRWLWRRIKEVRPNLQAAGFQADHKELTGKTTIEITRITPENDAGDPGEGIDLFNRADREEDNRDSEGVIPLNDPGGKPAEELTYSDSGNITNISPMCSGVESTVTPVTQSSDPEEHGKIRLAASQPCDRGDTGDNPQQELPKQGFPPTIEGLGKMQRSGVGRCTHCDELTCFAYGGTLLCSTHARAEADSRRREVSNHSGEDGSKTGAGDCDTITTQRKGDTMEGHPNDFTEPPRP